jgi:hypothetical protein
LTFTTYLQANLVEKTCRATDKQNVSISVSVTVHRSPFASFSVYNMARTNLCTALGRQNTTENNNINSHAQDTTTSNIILS